MGLVLVTAPLAEPVSRETVKDHCRITDNLQNDRIDRYMVSARAYAENRLGRQLVNATWRYSFDKFPCSTNCISIPRPPLVSITHVKYLDTAGTLTTLDAGEYYVDTDSEPGRVALMPESIWPATSTQINSVRITFVAGYGADGDDVPQDIKHAIEMLAAHFYENREATSEKRMQSVPLTADALLDLHRVETYLYPNERELYL